MSRDRAFFQIRDITKEYPSVRANDKITFAIGEGEVFALLGENGSGKSTLVKTIYGLVKPDWGTMQFQGRDYAPSDPNDAKAAGVAMVFQHFSLFEALTVAENIALGMDRPPARRELPERIHETSRTFGLALEPDSLVGALSAGERQRVEIIRCLLQNPKILIMDEPTSVLTPQEAETLFFALKRLAQDGTTIIYISHKLEEIRDLCHQAVVLRDGKVAGTCDPKETSARQLAEMMVGKSYTEPHRASTIDVNDEVGFLSVKDIQAKPGTPFGTPLQDISFEVAQGEVFGIGGVAGNGQDELFEILSGERQAEEGSIQMDGEELIFESPNSRRKKGLLFAPEQRIGHAAAGEMTLTQNAFLTGADRQDLTRYGFIDWIKTRSFAQAIVNRFDVRTPGVQNMALSLSGGNLQKFVIGREIIQNPRVLIVNQPTWGVDAAAAASIRQRLMDLADHAAAVVIISQDIDELLAVSDSIAVLNDGKLSAKFPARRLTREGIGLLMGGSFDTTVGEMVA